MKEKIITAINLYCDNKISKEALHACLIGYGLSDNQLNIIAPACQQISFLTFSKIAEKEFEFDLEAIKEPHIKHRFARVFHFLVHNENKSVDNFMRLKHPDYWSANSWYQVGSQSYNGCRWEYISLIEKYPTFDHWINISPTCQKIVKEKRELINILVDLAFPPPSLIENAEHL